MKQPETWADLSDAELRARLVNRGCDEADAISLVSRREKQAVASLISGWLGR